MYTQRVRKMGLRIVMFTVQKFRSKKNREVLGKVWSMCNVPWPTPGVTTNWETLPYTRERVSSRGDKGHTLVMLGNQYIRTHCSSTILVCGHRVYTHKKLTSYSSPNQCVVQHRNECVHGKRQRR